MPAYAGLQLNLDVDASGEVELHQGINGLGRRIDDVQEPLMRADFELLARLLVDVRRAVHGELLDAGRQRNGSANRRTGALGGVDDLARGLIQHAMIERLQADTDVLAVHDSSLLSARLFDDRGDDAGADGAAA